MTGDFTDPAIIAAQGQRRYLTLLFADLSGSTSLGEQMEAEDYAAMLANLRALCRETIPRHGGHIARMQGDGVLALFGYPEPREDDGRRATEAALELHAGVSALATRGPDGAPLTLHSGIHAGLVLISSGDVERGRFELLGNAPNVAARLAAMAQAGELLVSEETLGPQARFFVTSEIRNVEVKGRTAALPILRVLEPAAAADGSPALSRPDRGPFVGRHDALQLLSAPLNRALLGMPQCVAVCGGPGMGKTRFIEQLMRQPLVREFMVVRGYCESYLSAEPLQPFAQIMRSLLAGADTMIEACQRVSREGSAAIADLFALLAARQPLMLVIDDWQWADEASQLALDSVMGLPGPICVVLASRVAPEGLARVPTLIELLPFGDEEAAQAVQHLLPGADPFMIAEIHRYAGGIPLFIDELCHSAAAQGVPGLTNLRGSGRAWLNLLIQSRVDRLSPVEAALARAASIIGNVFPVWLLERITGHGAGSPATQALAAKDFVFAGEQPGTLRFKHGITRDAIYETVGLRERKEMHRRIALTLLERIETGDPDELLEALAYHCDLGDMPQEAARQAERAGDKAMAASALDRARAQYAAALRALDLTAPLDRDRQLRWCAVAQKLGLACVFDPLALADGLATFERSVALARASGDLLVLARAQYWLGYLCYAKGLARPAITHCEAALKLAVQMNDSRLESQVRATLGQAMLSACQYDQALVLLDAALESRRRPAGGGDRIGIGAAYSLACKGYLLGDRGHFAGADECFAEALHLLGDVHHQVAASVRHWLSVVRQWQGRWQEGLQAAEEAAAIALHVKSRQQLAMGRALAGHARWMMDHEEQALQAIRDATAWIEAQKGGLATSLNHGWMVQGALAQGRHAEVRRHAALLLRRARQEDRIGEALGCRALAEAASAAGDFGRAQQWLQRAQRSAEIRGSAHERAVNTLCEAALQRDQGRTGQARQLLDEACAAFEPMRMRWHLEQAQRMAASMRGEAPAAPARSCPPPK